jgi:GntR family transcriptional regulator
MNLLKLDPRSPVPIFQQIMDGLKGLILGGAFDREAFLPSVRALAQELKVNPNTAARAFRELEREGGVDVVRGEGYKARKPPAPAVRAFVGEKERRLAEAVIEMKKAGQSDQDIVGAVRRLLEGSHD